MTTAELTMEQARQRDERRLGEIALADAAGEVVDKGELERLRASLNLTPADVRERVRAAGQAARRSGHIGTPTPFVVDLALLEKAGRRVAGIDARETADLQAQQRSRSKGLARIAAAAAGERHWLDLDAGRIVDQSITLDARKGDAHLAEAESHAAAMATATGWDQAAGAAAARYAAVRAIVCGISPSLVAGIISKATEILTAFDVDARAAAIVTQSEGK